MYLQLFMNIRDLHVIKSLKFHEVSLSRPGHFGESLTPGEKESLIKQWEAELADFSSAFIG